MSISELAKQYNSFQENFCKTCEADLADVISGLFEDKFQKIANGAVLVANRNGLADQLSEVKNIAGKWALDVKDIIPSRDDKKCTIRYVISTEKAGKFDVLAVLSSNNGMQISKIDELFYQIGQ